MVGHVHRRRGTVWSGTGCSFRSTARCGTRCAWPACTRESAEAVSVYVAGPSIERLRAESGQFFRWRFLTRDLWWAANPYSLSAAPRPDMLRITVKTVGDHSRSLLNLAPGTRVFAEGPYGA